MVRVTKFMLRGKVHTRRRTPAPTLHKLIEKRKLDRAVIHHQLDNLVIPKATFRRIVQEITQSLGGDIPLQETACDALHKAGEAFLAALLEGAKLFAAEESGTTVPTPDIKKLARDFLLQL